jgi:predicted  nucleic acid-binding Zn-ribbon protein
MNVSDLIPWIGALAVVITAVVAVVRLRSQAVLVDPNTLSTMSSTMSREIERRRALEQTVDIANRRISSLEHNEQMNQRRMQDLETTLDEWSKGIEILIEQIKRHDSKPNWTPYGDKGIAK